MRRFMTEREKELLNITEPYFDYSKFCLIDGAPEEIVNALEELKRISTEEDSKVI